MGVGVIPLLVHTELAGETFQPSEVKSSSNGSIFEINKVFNRMITGIFLVQDSGIFLELTSVLFFKKSMVFVFKSVNNSVIDFVPS